MELGLCLGEKGSGETGYQIVVIYTQLQICCLLHQ